MHDEIQLTVNKGKNGYTLHVGGAKTGINRDFGSLWDLDQLTVKMGEMVEEYIGECGNEEDEKLNLMYDNDEKLQEIAMKDYHGSKDRWESYYENWLSNLTLQDVKDLLE